MASGTTRFPRSALVFQYIYTVEDGEERIITEVMERQTNDLWVVEEIPYLDRFLAGFDYLILLHWTADGKPLYASHHTTGGDGCYSPGCKNGKDLLRIDLETRQVNHLIDAWMMDIAISPYGKYLANVLDWNKMDLAPIYADNPSGISRQNYDILWSPDSQSFLYIATKGGCEVFDARYSVVEVNVYTGRQQVNIEQKANGMESRWYGYPRG
jgi:hypothetical protein